MTAMTAAPATLPLHALHTAWTALRASFTRSTPGHARSHYPLAHCQCLRVAKPAGRTVHCTEGSVWLTHDADPHDIVLQAGQSWTCTKPTRLLVMALEPARVLVD